MIEIDARWDGNKRQPEGELIAKLTVMAALDQSQRAAIVRRAAGYIEHIRHQATPGLMEVFLAEYGLSTDEGIALMCLAEALLRVPDAHTIDALIEDKIASSDWSAHLGHSSSPLVNASTWGLMLTGRVLEPGGQGLVGTLHSMIQRLGEPVIRTAVGAAIRQMGRQFVLGESIGAAMDRAKAHESRGYCYSYDMLGEAALTASDARRYASAYREAIDQIKTACASDQIADNPGISIKLSALHPRYEVSQAKRVLHELVPVVSGLARQAAAAKIGLNIDAEEADRLGLSMAVIRAVLADPDLAQWQGFGVVVQAYGRRAGDIIDGLHDMAKSLDRRIMVRLVKGAYWDTEIKHAQVEGLSDFPVFTSKAATDISYIALSRKLLGMTDHIYPQFATHNAHSVAAILEMAEALPKGCFEFQRLHGMGEALHDHVMDQAGTRCRIYAPVGSHRDLLAYLVRRLLENGANSSFVNQIVDHAVPLVAVARCPFETHSNQSEGKAARIPTGPALFLPQRVNSVGWDLNDTTVLAEIARHTTRPEALDVHPILDVDIDLAVKRDVMPILTPTTGQTIGAVRMANDADIDQALALARLWGADTAQRAAILNRVADLYEEHWAQAFGLLAIEAGKTLVDAVGELREAVDFLRYYAAQVLERAQITTPDKTARPRGTIVCISPWNFPLAIFTGQITAALATGNAVVSKPAESTSAIAFWAIGLMHRAGVPRSALQLLPGQGHVVGQALTSDARVNAVAFTGSTATARRIQRNVATHCAPGTPLVAETGGLNAMVVDSTALPEQAIQDIIASAFQSAGQRCSALRCLYVQQDIASAFIAQLIGAMDQLLVGDPWALETDVGPIITQAAAQEIQSYCQQAGVEGRLLHQVGMAPPRGGNFVLPTLIRVDGIGDLSREVFGPVLHVATFQAQQFDQVLDQINAKGYGLTFGIHTRIDDRIQSVTERVTAGNMYANRNQIGAIVGSQPFGGEGLSGTGPKAGGPNYLARFMTTAAPLVPRLDDLASGPLLLNAGKDLAHTFSSHLLPGPTGELNQLTTHGRAPIICAGPGAEAAKAQMQMVEALGGKAVLMAQGIAPDSLKQLPSFGGVIWWGTPEVGHEIALALCDLPGPILPLITDCPDKAHARLERHLCVDTTAAGGNVSLLSGEVGDAA